MSMKDRITLEIDLPDLDVEETGEKVLDVFKGEVLTSVKDHSPVDTGYLREHWHEGDRSKKRVEIYNNTIYALWLVRGTGIYGPHRTPICATGIRYAGTIMAVDKPKVLHWKDKAGNDVFRACVKGIKPRTFVDDGVKEGVENAVLALQEMFFSQEEEGVNS